MIVTEFNPSVITPLKTTKAPVPQFGNDAEMVVTELSGKCRAYRDQLFKYIKEHDAELSEYVKGSVHMFAMIVPCIVHPETRDPLIKIGDFIQFTEVCNDQTTDALIEAYYKVNPVKDEPVVDTTKTTVLKEKKSRSSRTRTNT